MANKKHIHELQAIASILLAPDYTYLNLRNTCIALKKLFCQSLIVDDQEFCNMPNIITEAGIATNPYGAVQCIIDMMRTRTFLVGIHEAIKDQLAKKPGKPVVVLYAGTGPFAALLTPLTTVFTPAELQMVLIEINPFSMGYLRKTIDHFCMQPFIKAVIETDAASYHIPDEFQPAIIISETMMAALKNEPQLAIMANLVSQCNGNTVIIPEIIKIEAAFTTNNKGEGIKVFPIKTLLEFTRETARLMNNKMNILPIFNQGVVTHSTELPEPSFKRLSLVTSIQVFKNHKLALNESSLTFPQHILDISAINNWPATFRFKYKMGLMPAFVMSHEPA